jgi:hypothetical protein
LTKNQRRVFGSFLVLLFASQCVAVVVSFSESADALRVWVSPQLRPSTRAALRAVVVGEGNLEHRRSVRYSVRITSPSGRDLQLIERLEDSDALDLDFLVPNWIPGEVRIIVTAIHSGGEQTVHIPITLTEERLSGVSFVEPWQASAARDPSDATDERPKRFDRLPLTAFPETGWAVRNHDLPLIVRRRSGTILRVRPQGSLGVGHLFDPAGFALLTLAQPLRRGRFRVQTAGGDGAWTSHDLWLHNPPAELRLTSPKREVAAGEEMVIEVRSDRKQRAYSLQVYRGAQWQNMTQVQVVNSRAELRLEAPREACWMSVVWASDLVTDSRRKAFITFRVGGAALPAGVPDRLAHPGTALGRRALISRVHPLRLQPPLRANTIALKKAQVVERREERQRWANLAFQLIATAFIAWVFLNILVLQHSRKQSRKQLALEMEEAKFLEGSATQNAATVLLLLGLLCLLFMMSYLFNHMVWGL